MSKYEVSDERRAFVHNLFVFHPVKDDQPERYALLREKFEELSILILENTPESREQTLAIRKLKEAAMGANEAIAVNE